MDRKQLLKFEISIFDLVDSIKPVTLGELEKIAEALHQHMELALIDYADGEGWGDEYSPAY